MITFPAVACGVWGDLSSFSHVLKLLFTQMISNTGAESGHHLHLPGPSLFSWVPLSHGRVTRDVQGPKGGLVSAARLSYRGSLFPRPPKHHQWAQRDAGSGCKCPLMLSAMGLWLLSLLLASHDFIEEQSCSHKREPPSCSFWQWRGGNWWVFMPWGCVWTVVCLFWSTGKRLYLACSPRGLVWEPWSSEHVAYWQCGIKISSNAAFSVASWDLPVTPNPAPSSWEEAWGWTWQRQWGPRVPLLGCWLPY